MKLWPFWLGGSRVAEPTPLVRYERARHTRRFMVEVRYRPDGRIDWSVFDPDKSARTPFKKWTPRASGLDIGYRDLVQALGRIVMWIVDDDARAVERKEKLHAKWRERMRSRMQERGCQ